MDAGNTAWVLVSVALVLLMTAIITPALITGAFADRMLFEEGALDFTGGVGGLAPLIIGFVAGAVCFLAIQLKFASATTTPSTSSGCSWSAGSWDRSFSASSPTCG